ncbi:MAG: IS1182 family transposase [Chloroflexota bacterium]
MVDQSVEQEKQYEVTCVDELVRKDHLLRKIAKYVDFRFIREKTRPLYAENIGRPAIDPVVLFKMLFIGYLYGIRSERRLVQEINDNIAYRWFLGFGFRDRIPDHSTLSQNRRRRFNGTPIFQEIFDEIVRQAISKGLIDGKVIYTDSTHVKANANKKKFLPPEVPVSVKAYEADLDKAVEEDRRDHGRKPLKAKRDVTPETRQIKVSTTDPESGYMMREGKPEGFFYLNHRSVDGKYNFVTDVHVTPANQTDAECYLERLDRQKAAFDFAIQAVGLDAGYMTTPICKGLEDRRILGVIGHRRFHPVKGLFQKWKFRYDAESDTYTCPNGKILTYGTTNREGMRIYNSRRQDCSQCPLREQCTRSKSMRKQITRHVWEDARENVREYRLSDFGKEVYARRKETIERSFADGKELHGLRYARMRGLLKVLEQCLVSAAVQNMKKMALILARRELAVWAV